MSKPNVLFLCTGNACRSQMAEGFARALLGSRINVFSAGIEPHGMNRRAMRVMAEAGVSIESHRSKHVDELRGVTFDHVITVCGNADQNCPVLPGPARRHHHGFDDPPKLAANAQSEEEALTHYRRVRDEIRCFVETELPRLLGLEPVPER